MTQQEIRLENKTIKLLKTIQKEYKINTIDEVIYELITYSKLLEE